MQLDRNDPYLRHNLNRLEKRFRQRYYASRQKQLKQIKAGKSVHKTTAQSLKDNRNRLNMVKTLQHILFEKELKLTQ